MALGRVILPTDSASPATRRRFEAFAASRHERTRAPQEPRRTLFRPDIVGTLEAILGELARDPVLLLVSELRLELPCEFEPEDYAQILADLACAIPAVLRG